MGDIKELRQRYKRFREAVARYKSAVGKNQFEELEKIAPVVEKTHWSVNKTYKRLESKFDGENLPEGVDSEELKDITNLFNKYASTRRELNSIKNELLSIVEECIKREVPLNSKKIKLMIARAPHELNVDDYEYLSFIYQ